MGGMGVLVLFLALLPRASGAGTVYLMRAELPGPIKDKLVPRVSDTAKLLYSMYIGLTVLETALICTNLVIQGKLLFQDALVDAAFETVSFMTTAGYATTDYTAWPVFSQMILWMLLGRLELMPILVMLSPGTWKER